MSSRPAIHEDIDASVVHKIADGDVAAFEEFYDASIGVLYSLGQRILQHPEDVEELIQDVFTKIWQDASHYDPSRGAPLAWAIMITRNRAIDRVRSNARRFNLQEAAAREAESSVTEAEPTRSAERAESSRAVHDSVASLSPEVRETIELAYFGGLSQSQIARKLSIPLTTVKSRIRTAMVRLRQTLKSYA